MSRQGGKNKSLKCVQGILKLGVLVTLGMVVTMDYSSLRFTNRTSRGEGYMKCRLLLEKGTRV